MTTQALTLTDFLLARIAEDEQRAKYVRDFGTRGPRHTTLARVLAECEAKRRIVEEYAAARTARLRRPSGDPVGAIAAGIHIAIRLLALPYFEHPDYREEWKP